MSELRLPLDIEQLTEVCQLRHSLRSLRDGHHGAKQIESVAVFLVLRLFIVLGYLARSTNRPGCLTAGGALQLRDSLREYGETNGNHLLVEGWDPVKLLEDAGLLVKVNDEWRCELFARLNEHLAGDYRPAHMKGNDMRQVSIAIKDAAVNAPKQAMMLLSEICHKPDGTKFDPQELDRLMMLIRAIDNIFQFSRQRSQFTESLLQASAAACGICNYQERSIPQELRRFLGWLHNHKKHPRVPTTTDEVLRDFKTLYALAEGDALK